MSNANVIKPNEMFATPNSFDEIMDWVNLHAKEDRVHLMTAAMMAWNLAAKASGDLVKEIEELCADCDSDGYLQAEIGGAGSVTYAIRKILKGDTKDAA